MVFNCGGEQKAAGHSSGWRLTLTPAAPGSAGALWKELRGLDELLLKHTDRETLAGPAACWGHEFDSLCTMVHPGDMLLCWIPPWTLWKRHRAYRHQGKVKCSWSAQNFQRVHRQESKNVVIKFMALCPSKFDIFVTILLNLSETSGFILWGAGILIVNIVFWTLVTVLMTFNSIDFEQCLNNIIIRYIPYLFMKTGSGGHDLTSLN